MIIIYYKFYDYEHIFSCGSCGVEGAKKYLKFLFTYEGYTLVSYRCDNVSDYVELGKYINYLKGLKI